MEKQALIKIIESLKEVRTETKSKVSDEVLFDAGCRIYTSEQIELHRQGSSVSKSKFAASTNLLTSPAAFIPSPGQRYTLRKKFTDEQIDKMSKAEVTRLIDEIKGKNFKRNRESFERALA